MTEPLRQDLDRVAESAGAALIARRVWREVARAAEVVPALVLVAPLLALCLYGLTALFGSTARTIPLWLLAVMAFGPPLGYVLLRMTTAAVKPVGYGNALAAIDRELGLEGRLTAAAAFLDLRDRTPFMEAAIADAATRTEEALEARLSSTKVAWSFSRAARIQAAVALVLLIIAFNLGGSEVSGADATVEGRATKVASIPPVEGRGETDDVPVRPRPDRPREEAKKPLAPGKGAAAKTGDREEDLTDSKKETRGKTAVGRPSNASSSSGQSESRGQPSSQEQASLTSKKKAKKPAKKAVKKDRPPDPDKPRKPEEESGATAGRGLTSGSSRSPAATEWKSKDQVTSEEEEDLEDDEEVEDEFDENAARGGVQPQLRDRKPPVNRDLSIGFGNQKNPDANGRGGPSQRKKSRGVAALVLGVPIPDHVKGKPNPGKTKTTQERVQPQPEEVPSVTAGKRAAREDPIGHLSHTEMTPWMRALVRAYFLSLREN